MGDVKTNRRCLETAGCFTGIHFQARIPQTLSGLDVQQLPSRARHHLVRFFYSFRCRGAQVAQASPQRRSVERSPAIYLSPNLILC